jgi:hypothetical protein
MPDLQPFLIPLLSAVASFIGAWLAAYFALRRFYKERIWERKVEAYSAIFAALHDVDMWYSKQFDAMVEQREIPENERRKLQLAAIEAERDLEKRLASEIWLIPDHCRDRLVQLTRDLKNQTTTDWNEYLSTGASVIHRGINDLRAMVRADLDIKDKHKHPKR